MSSRWIVASGRFEVVHALEVEPELGGGSEGFCDSQGRR